MRTIPAKKDTADKINAMMVPVMRATELWYRDESRCEISDIGAPRQVLPAIVGFPQAQDNRRTGTSWSLFARQVSRPPGARQG